jgi:hypothetical protein
MSGGERAGTRGAWILGGAIVIAALFLGGSFYAARADRNTVQVVGMASQPFEADQVKWSLSVSRTVPVRELRSGYVRIGEDVERIVAGLAGAGVPRGTVTLQPVTTNPMYGPDGIRDYQVNQSLFLVSEDLDAVERLALDPAGLLGEGVLLQQSRLEYFYSGLAEVKRSLLAKATEDARMRAEEIASATGEGISGIAAARAGVFQITEPFSTEVAAYGIHDTSSRRKEIRVTVHATFVLD